MNYEVIKIRTAMTEGKLESGLSFLEGGQDIPFQINRLYCIYETEKEKRGFYENEKEWQLLFCPYGEIDVMIDDGTKEEIIALNNPSVGLVLYSELWREVSWIKSGSVLCVATSSSNNIDRLCCDYSAFINSIQNKS